MKPAQNIGPGSTSVVGDDFEIRLPKLQSIEISVVESESGQPVEIENAAIALSQWPGRSIYGYRRFEMATNQNQVEAKYLPVGRSRIWINPVEKSRCVSGFVDIDIKSDQPSPKMLVLKLPNGIVVSGKVVAEKGGLPIADAAIQYLPKTPGVLLAQGIYHPDFVRTDENGTFSFIAPRVDGLLQVIGDCKEFQTLPKENARLKKHEILIPDDVAARLEREIYPEDKATIEVPAFQLKLAPVLTGTVLDENNQPLSDVAFVVDRGNETQGRSFVFGKTDDRGRFAITMCSQTRCTKISPNQNCSLVNQIQSSFGTSDCRLERV